MAKMAPLSLAVATFMPVFTRFCATLRSRLVALRFCSATRAPTFVLMLLAILAVLCLRRCPTPFWLPGAFCSEDRVANGGPKRHWTDQRQGFEFPALDSGNHVATLGIFCHQ